MEKLFAVYVGGMIEGCHVELHDVRFVIGERIEDCYDDLKAQWWGLSETLHLDAWGALTWADGYHIDLVDAPQADDVKLYFVNLGGYDRRLFTELHENVFVVAENPREAKQRALRRIQDWFSPHRDAVKEIETVIDVAAATGAAQRFIRLSKDYKSEPFDFETRYVPIGRMA